MIDRSLYSKSGHLNDNYFTVRHGFVNGLDDYEGSDVTELFRDELPFKFYGSFGDFALLDKEGQNDRSDLELAGAWIGVYTDRFGWTEEIVFHFEFEEDAVLARLHLGSPS